VTFPQNVEKVTPADVQRVARKYFDEDQSTTGWFVPVVPQPEKGS
jgi:zinc protease